MIELSVNIIIIIIIIILIRYHERLTRRIFFLFSRLIGLAEPSLFLLLMVSK